MEAVAEYLGALQSEQGASPNTLAAYRRDLADFLRFLATRRLVPGAAQPDDVVSWLERLRARGLAPASVARRLSAVRGFYRHLLREGDVRRDPTEHLAIGVNHVPAAVLGGVLRVSDERRHPSVSRGHDPALQTTFLPEKQPMVWEVPPVEHLTADLHLSGGSRQR